MDSGKIVGWGRWIDFSATQGFWVAVNVGDYTYGKQIDSTVESYQKAYGEFCCIYPGEDGKPLGFDKGREVAKEITIYADGEVISSWDRLSGRWLTMSGRVVAV